MSRATNRHRGFKNRSFNWAASFDECHVVHEGNIFFAGKHPETVVMLVGSAARKPMKYHDMVISYNRRREIHLASKEEVVMARLTGKLIYIEGSYLQPVSFGLLPNQRNYWR